MINPEAHMNLFDFLAQASGWQWFGLVVLTGIVGGTFAACCAGLGNLRVQGDITNNRVKNYHGDGKS